MILTEIVKDNIVDLQTLPKDILDKRKELNGLSGNELKIIEREMEELESEALFEVSEDKDEKGKPKFSNKETRDAEKSRRLRDDVAYQKLIAKKDEIQDKRADIDLGIKALQDNLSAQKALAYLLGGILSSGYNHALDI